MKNKFYGFYVTIYGGKTQDLICENLTNSIIKVWDNSDMYNDFIIKVTENISGKFLLKHSEYDNYKHYCELNNIPFDENKVKKEIEFIQITDDDAMGIMEFEYNGNIFHRGEIITINLSNLKESIINIQNMSFMKQLSLKKYEINNNIYVDYNPIPDWVNCKQINNQIILKANSQNNLLPRKYRIKTVNKDNPHQYIFIDVQQ